MLIDNYKDKYNELNFRRDELAEKRRQLDVKENLAKSGKLEDKFGGILVGSMATYAAMTIGLMFAGEDFVHMIPRAVGTSAILGASVLNGFAVKSSLDKKSETAKRRNETFDGKGQRYFMEQEALAAIESDKCSSRIKVLKHVRDRLENEIHTLETINDNFVVVSTDDNISEQEICNKIEEDIKKISSAYTDLDKASIKSTLSTKFCDVYGKADAASLLFGFFSAGGLAALLSTYFPETIYTDFYDMATSGTLTDSVLRTMTPVVLGGGLALGYGIKRLADEKAVLKRVNKNVFGKRKADGKTVPREDLAMNLSDAIYNTADLEYDLLVNICKLEDKVGTEKASEFCESVGTVEEKPKQFRKIYENFE